MKHQRNANLNELITKRENLFPAGLEPATLRALGGRDNHYTTETMETCCHNLLLLSHWNAFGCR